MPLTKIDKSIVIHAPTEKVYAYIKDIDNFAKAQPPETETKVLSKPEGGPKVGQISRMSMKAGGQVYEWENEITEVTENKKMSAIQKGGPFKRLEWTQTCEPTNGETKYSLTCEYELPYSIVGKIIDKLKIEKEVDRNFDYYIKKTKELIEKSA